MIKKDPDEQDRVSDRQTTGWGSLDYGMGGCPVRGEYGVEDCLTCWPIPALSPKLATTGTAEIEALL